MTFEALKLMDIISRVLDKNEPTFQLRSKCWIRYFDNRLGLEVSANASRAGGLEFNHGWDRAM